MTWTNIMLMSKDDIKKKIEYIKENKEALLEIIDNWERMSKLSKFSNRTKDQEEEYNYRIKKQNHYANTGELI